MVIKRQKHLDSRGKGAKLCASSNSTNLLRESPWELAVVFFSSCWRQASVLFAHDDHDDVFTLPSHRQRSASARAATWPLLSLLAANKLSERQKLERASRRGDVVGSCTESIQKRGDRKPIVERFESRRFGPLASALRKRKWRAGRKNPPAPLGRTTKYKHERPLVFGLHRVTRVQVV